MNIPKEYLIEIDGRQFVTYAGLLDLAHHTGLQSLTVTVSQCPSPSNECIAIAAATATLTDGRIFSDIGDASPSNVGNPAIALHLIRVASTRAKARCLRDALGVGLTCVEELPSAIPTDQRPAMGSSSSQVTPRQLSVLHKQATLLMLSRVEIDQFQSLTKAEASTRIQEYNRLLARQSVEVTKPLNAIQ